MAQKVHPVAVRLGLNRSSDSSWFSDYYYTTLFYKDINLRNYLSSIRQPSGNKLGIRTGRCVIHHYPKRSFIHFFCLIGLDSKRKVKPISTNIQKTNLNYSYKYRLPVVYDPERKHIPLMLDALNSAHILVNAAKEGNNTELDSHISDLNASSLFQHKQTIYLNVIKRVSNYWSFKYNGEFDLHSNFNYSKEILMLKRLGQRFKEKWLIQGKQPQIIRCDNTEHTPLEINGRVCVDKFNNTAVLSTKNKSNSVVKHRKHQLNSKRRQTPFNSLFIDWISMNQLFRVSGWTSAIVKEARETQWVMYKNTKEMVMFKDTTCTPSFLAQNTEGNGVDNSIHSHLSLHQFSMAHINYLAMWYWMYLKTNSKLNCNYDVTTQHLRAVTITITEPSLTKNRHYHFTNIQSFLSSQSNTLTLIVPIKLSSIYQSASLVAQEICCKLEQKRSFRQICKSVFRQIDLCKYIKGIRISCSGRLNGAEIAKSECKKFGETSLHVFSDQIDYAYAKASTAYGILGVKVWISYF